MGAGFNGLYIPNVNVMLNCPLFCHFVLCQNKNVLKFKKHLPQLLLLQVKL